MLCVVDLRSNLMEAILVPYDLGLLADLELKYNEDVVNEYKARCKSMSLISDEEIERRCNEIGKMQ